MEAFNVLNLVSDGLCLRGGSNTWPKCQGKLGKRENNSVALGQDVSGPMENNGKKLKILRGILNLTLKSYLPCQMDICNLLECLGVPQKVGKMAKLRAEQIAQ